tara:strand:+ start:451 stop:753 length:303 start_codon:yes stop_codon:yes gene_type:complete
MNKTDKGMVRESKDEKYNHLSYTTPHNLTRYAAHMKLGEIKHGRSNWKKGGYNREEWFESMQRHLLLAWEGDTSEDHLSAIRFNVEGIMHQEVIESATIK